MIIAIGALLFVIAILFIALVVKARYAMEISLMVSEQNKKHHAEMRHLFDALLASELTERKDILKACDEIETRYLQDGSSFHVFKDV